MIINFEVKYDWVSRSIIFKLDDDNYSAIWVNHKTVFGPYPKPKYIAYLGPKIQIYPKIRSKSNARIE